MQPEKAQKRFYDLDKSDSFLKLIFEKFSKFNLKINQSTINQIAYHKSSNCPLWNLTFELHSQSMKNKLIWQNILIALNAVKSQKLRTFLTVMIIAVGIMALVGILTAIDSMKETIQSQFTSMGANSFTIRRKVANNVRQEGKKGKTFPVISYREAQTFVDRFEYPGRTSISTRVSSSAVVRFKNKETNPNSSINGGDENFLVTKGYKLRLGRNFSSEEVKKARNVAIIGDETANELFNNIDPVGQIINVRNIKYIVIGVLEKKGSSMGFGGDRNIIIPITNVRQYFFRKSMSFGITVLSESPAKMAAAINEATGIFRIIRRDPLEAENSFRIYRSDSLASRLIDNLSMVSLVATLVGIITLLGAAIGLMNIMLVSVTERTREIGIRIAIGAKPRLILSQFLVEAVVICQIGGLVGIFLGMLAGNSVAIALDGSFIIPWFWIITAIILCVFVGVLAGFYPAVKASKLDPIDALRYE